MSYKRGYNNYFRKRYYDSERQRRRSAHHLGMGIAETYGSVMFLPFIIILAIGFAIRFWYISICFIVILFMLAQEKEKMLKPYHELQAKYDRIVNDYELLTSLVDKEAVNGLQMIIEELTNNIEKMESYRNRIELSRKENLLRIEDSSYEHHIRMANSMIKKMESARCDAYRRMYKLEYEAKKGTLN